MILLFSFPYFCLITKSLGVNALLFAMRAGKLKCHIKTEIPHLMFLREEKCEVGFYYGKEICAVELYLH